MLRASIERRMTGADRIRTLRAHRFVFVDGFRNLCLSIYHIASRLLPRMIPLPHLSMFPNAITVWGTSVIFQMINLSWSKIYINEIWADSWKTYNFQGWGSEREEEFQTAYLPHGLKMHSSPSNVHLGSETSSRQGIAFDQSIPSEHGGKQLRKYMEYLVLCNQERPRPT